MISDVINEIQGLHSAGQGTERYRLTHTRVRDFTLTKATNSRRSWGS